MERMIIPRQTICVHHPRYGTAKVRAATNKLDALMEAARRWGVQWSVILHEVDFTVEEEPL